MPRGAGADRPDKYKQRGQSVVIGSILIFGFLVAALGSYQVLVVPDQNAEVEATHANQIEEDFSELFAGILNSDDTGESHTAVVNLGTEYPARALTINPPEPSGTVRTAELGRIDGEIDADIDGSITTRDIEAEYCGLGTAGTEGNPFVRSLIYEPGYNELGGVGVHVYENTAVYQDYETSLVESEQQLVEGRNINLRPITRGDLSSTSTSAEAITFNSGVTGGETVETSSSWTLSLPTRVADGTDVDIWRQILEEPRNKGIVIGVSKGGPDSVDIEFASGTYQIKCTPLGVDETPENDPDFVPGDSSDGSDATINPTGSDALELKSVSKENGNKIGGGPSGPEKVKWEATFENNGGSKTIKEVRVPYVTSPGSSFDGELDLKSDGESVSVVVGEGFEEVGPVGSRWNWAAEPSPDDTDVIKIGDKNISPNQAGAALVVKFEDGSTATYFISTSN